MVQSETGVKKKLYTGFFLSELAHIVAMCDERIPYSALCREVRCLFEFTDLSSRLCVQMKKYHYYFFFPFPLNPSILIDENWNRSTFFFSPHID